MASSASRRVGGIELGGTKTVVVSGRAGEIHHRAVFPTTSPTETLARAANTLRDFHAHEPLHAIGIASFGPVRIDPAAADYGRILATPKPDWSGADLIGHTTFDPSIPIAIDTDVNAAALAEHRYGAAVDCPVVIYLTIGTGLGGGILVNGAPVHGVLHPEIGHIRTRRAPGDEFAGACPFHDDCIEGLICGPALSARFGRDPATIGMDDPLWEGPASDLAELLATLVMMHSPHRIVVGGGVGLGQPTLLRRAKELVGKSVSSYLTDFDEARIERSIIPARLREDAGPVGAMLLAENRLNSI